MNPRMEEPKDRLQRARKLAGFATAAEAADRFRWARQTYYQHEDGRRAITHRTAPRYARAFGVSEEWLLYGTGPNGDADLRETFEELRALPPEDLALVRNFVRRLHGQRKQADE